MPVYCLVHLMLAACPAACHSCADASNQRSLSVDQWVHGLGHLSDTLLLLLQAMHCPPHLPHPTARQSHSTYGQCSATGKQPEQLRASIALALAVTAVVLACMFCLRTVHTAQL